MSKVSQSVNVSVWSFKFTLTTLALATLVGATATMPYVAAAPAITEYPVPTANSYPTSVATASNGAMWFNEGAGKIGRITTSGVVTEFTLPIDGYANNFVKGPGGDVWFSMQDTGDGKFSIGHVSSSGNVTYFPVSTVTTYNGVTNLIASSDDTLWYQGTDSRYNSLSYMAHVDASGNILREYPLGFFNVRGMAFGSDGNIWFGDTTINRVCRFMLTLNNNYEVNCYATHKDGPAESLTLGPDGAIWFVGNDSVAGRIAIDGTATTYQLPTPDALAQDIVSGPDGALWISRPYANNITRLTVSGISTENHLSDSDPSGGGGLGVFGLTVGTDSAIWFTEMYGNSIGRLPVIIAPVVTITSPTNNSTVNGDVAINASIQSNSAYNVMLYVYNAANQAVVAKYQYAVPQTNSEYMYNWDTTGVPNGNYTIILSAKDAQGNKDANSTSKVKVTVAN